MKCLRCPESAEKCIRDEIHLKKGFWRENNLTDIIVDCYNKETNCDGHEASNKGYCIKGSIGPLCEKCDIYGVRWGERYA